MIYEFQKITAHFFFLIKLKLINLLFELEVRQINFVKQTTPVVSSRVHKCISTFLQNNPRAHWAQFKLARMCARYTYFDLADEVYTRLSSTISQSMFNMSTHDLSYTGWLDFMAMVCRAEARPSPSIKSNSQLINCLNESLAYYMRAQSLYKATCTRSLVQSCAASTSTAASTNSSASSTTAAVVHTPALENSNACFQIRYCELRSEQVRMFLHLVMSAMTFVTCPAPAFQFNSADSFAKLGRVAHQMKYSVAELQKLNQKYKELLSECFDADQHTINILNMCFNRYHFIIIYILELSN
jgi:hypothetical protein